MRSLAFRKPQMFSAWADRICAVLKQEGAAASAAGALPPVRNRSLMAGGDVCRGFLPPNVQKDNVNVNHYQMCQILTNHLGAVRWQWWALSFSPPQSRPSTPWAPSRRWDPEGPAIWLILLESCSIYNFNLWQEKGESPARRKASLTQKKKKKGEQNIPCSVSCARSPDVLLPEPALHTHVPSVLALQTCREQFGVRSQESSLHTVPKGWAETGKKFVRTSAASLTNTQQKRLKARGRWNCWRFWKPLQEDESVDICRHFLPAPVCLSLTFIW